MLDVIIHYLGTAGKNPGQGEGHSGDIMPDL